MTSLYRLDQVALSSGQVSLGPLPKAAKALLITLGLCWAAMGIYVAVDKTKKKNL